jgi:hypothetical protein
MVGISAGMNRMMSGCDGSTPLAAPFDRLETPSTPLAAAGDDEVWCGGPAAGATSSGLATVAVRRPVSGPDSGLIRGEAKAGVTSRMVV